MHEPALEERCRRLQRVAYGAVASDAERAAAVAELEAIRREQAVHAANDAAPTAEPPAPAPVVEKTPTGSVRAVNEWIAASDAASVRRFRWAVAAGTAALLVGIGVGWQLGTRTTASEPAALATPASPVDVAGERVPITETSVPRLFDAVPTPADLPATPSLDDRIAPEDYRLLITRPDGVALHVARLDPDVCVIVVEPSWGSAASCTVDGLIPQGGLWVEARGRGETIRGTVHVDGTAELTPNGYLPDRLPSTNG